LGAAEIQQRQNRHTGAIAAIGHADAARLFRNSLFKKRIAKAQHGLLMSDFLLMYEKIVHEPKIVQTFGLLHGKRRQPSGAADCC
jgi:hypothetical protein